jgi:hypothetical protein
MALNIHAGGGNTYVSVFLGDMIKGKLSSNCATIFNTMLEQTEVQNYN